MLVLVALIVLVFLVVIAYTALPRWWAQTAGDQVGGSLSTGLVLGFMYGYFGTVLPAGVLALVYRFSRHRWLAWVIGGVTALVLAAPILLTLWIVVGTGSAAHAAERTLDVEAPWFRGGMLFGVIAAAITLLYLGYVLLGRSRARGAAARAREELAAATAPPPELPTELPPTASAPDGAQPPPT
jgi:ABC-type arginine/histidine transport system permease subunit